MSVVIPFRRRVEVEADIDVLAADVLFTLAVSAGVDTQTLITTFWESRPKLRSKDLIAALGLCHKILAVFERCALAHDLDDGGAA